ncbi:MAG TPA: xanthine dehydrogenase family protein molybdopterin-binding subunit [Xanthobacteraceae bacterium]|jgi:carbon-monoxide dehydrogenase large subunit
MTKAKFGQAIPRVEDRKLLIGHACYIDDISLPDLAHGAIVYSNHAHARIKSINTTRALRAPGVLGVLTGKDISVQGLGGLPPLFMPEDTGGPKGHRTARPLLAEHIVRHVGDRIAFCVAENLTQARDAVELIEIEYESLPSVTSLADAAATGAPTVWDPAPNNVCFTLRMGDSALAEKAFAEAAHRVRLRLTNNRVTASPLEPRGAIGFYNQGDESFTLYSSTQNPHRIRETLAHSVFGIPESKLRVVGPDVGGGFGMKGDTYPEEGIVLAASRAVGRPVKWIATRSDAFILDNAGRDQLIEAEMALDQDGRILAVRANAMQNLGAYIVGAALVPLVYSLKLIPNVYDIPIVDLTTQGVFTHTAPTNPYRGAGRPEAVYVTERLLDLAAESLRVDPLEIRKRNFIEKAALPYRSATGLVYDSGDFRAAADACLSLADWGGFKIRKQASRAAGKLRGRAVVSYIEDTGVFNDRMELRFDASGAITIVAGTFSHGQSHATTYSQCVSDWLGIPIEQIRFIQGDTEQVAFGRGTYASGSAIIGGSALRFAAGTLVEKAKVVASFLLEASCDDLEFSDGNLTVTGTDRAVSIQEVAKWTYHPTRLPKHLRIGLEASSYFAAEPPAFPNGCHICEVEIDPDTGEVMIDRYTAVDDFGRLINPLIVNGQVHGALAQGIGQAIRESMIYDKAGQLVTASFMDYAIPRAGDLPAFTLAFHEEPCRTNPLGVKGAGEGGCVAAPPAVMNAVLDALRPFGIHHLDMPATSERIWRAFKL